MNYKSEITNQKAIWKRLNAGRALARGLMGFEVPATCVDRHPVRLHFPPMRSHTLLVILALAGSSSTQAQVRLSARLGATWSSKLATDEIVEPIDVKAGIGPTLSVNASIPSGRKYRVGLETMFSTGSVKATENGSDTDLGSLRTASLLLTAEGPLMIRGVFWRVGVGFIKYLPSEKEGLFRQGGPTRLMGTFTAEYRKPLSPGWEGLASLRYGFHQFTTKELQAAGFSRAQSVHRVGLEVGVARYFQ